ncbi:hypothetical protein FEM48_Zijuj05G0016000 [Ziziphus jujuba var. spinosa]|uniref:Uncharacterized protein n=1 Tax=Ziziphus jujuba var. spinosa TaxID=714518 RepID=A0A978VC17_ZIZJJ|nr:hypothetical protein FEM48_Zijuj05G0016000 [Ziziphus jujuba var. spinosa]
MPLYLNLDDYLVLDNTSFDTFQHTINAPQSDSSLSPLYRLNTLCIIRINKLDITQYDNTKWERLQSLRFPRLDYLPKLDKLPDGLQHLTTLRQLHIWRCNIKTLPGMDREFPWS